MRHGALLMDLALFATSAVHLASSLFCSISVNFALVLPPQLAIAAAVFGRA